MTIESYMNMLRAGIAEYLDIEYSGAGPLSIDWDETRERIERGAWHIDVGLAEELLEPLRYAQQVAEIHGENTEVEPHTLNQAWANQIPPARALESA